MKKTITSSWDSVVKKLENRFGGGLDLQSILFLIGIQELGKGYQKLKKDQKVEVMHIAICALLSQWGYYEFVGYDEEGWPHWKTTENLPTLKSDEQTILLKEAAILYFEKAKINF